MNLSQFNLPSNTIEFDHQMAKILRSLTWSSSTNCDLLFLVTNRHYYAHSFLLSKICRSLPKLLIDHQSSPMRYTCQLQMTPPQGLELLLIYIYTARLILNVSTISDLYLAASELDVEEIVQRSIEFINQSIEKMYEKSQEELSLLWLFLTSCLLTSEINRSLCDRIIQAIRYFYPQIIDNERFLSLTSDNLIRMFELLFPNDIPASMILDSLHQWTKFTDQSSRQTTVEYLISKYLHPSNNNVETAISNQFVHMEKKLQELIHYQNNILHHFDDMDQLSSKEESLWTTESEQSIDSNQTNLRVWNIDNHEITTIAVCCPLGRDRQEISKDSYKSLHAFKQFDSSKGKYAFVHMGKYLYGIREYQTRMYKYNLISNQIQSIDGPYPGRSQFSLAANSQHLVLIGGINTEGKSISSSIRFHYQEQQWYSLPDIPTRNQRGVFASGMCFIDHDTLIIVGGFMMTSEGPMAMRKCFRLDLNKQQWTAIISCNEARGQPMVIYYSDTIYAIGGLQYVYDRYKRRTSINVMSIEEYNIHTDQWTIITNLNKLRSSQKNLYCTTDGILIGMEKKNTFWSYDLIKRHLTCNFGLSA